MVRVIVDLEWLNNALTGILLHLEDSCSFFNLIPRNAGGEFLITPTDRPSIWGLKWFKETLVVAV